MTKPKPKPRKRKPPRAVLTVRAWGDPCQQDRAELAHWLGDLSCKVFFGLPLDRNQRIEFRR